MLRSRGPRRAPEEGGPLHRDDTCLPHSFDRSQDLNIHVVSGALLYSTLATWRFGLFLVIWVFGRSVASITDLRECCAAATVSTLNIGRRRLEKSRGGDGLRRVSFSLGCSGEDSGSSFVTGNAV